MVAAREPLDALSLVEDELLLALPLVPRHDSCPMAVPMTFGDDPAASVEDRPNPFEALKARGILVRSLHGSHPLLANCLRLTVGTADENAKLTEALASILSPQNA